jgi:hypothetical protein
VTVEFVYQGFTQDGNYRCYAFDGVEGHLPPKSYAISVDLSLFSKHQVSFQSGPMFCLKILRSACEAGSDKLDKCRFYRAIDSDFADLMSERAARAAAIAMKKPARRFVRKPPPTSQLSRLGRLDEEPRPPESKS